MTPIERAFRSDRGLLWALTYRIVGTAVDADEIVQETFARAVERAPDTSRPLRPWLVRVASNLARDRLRRRRRRDHDGPWLPAPVLDAEDPLERRSELGYAWLVALEALTPNQRAVLVLREALDLSVQETAEALDLSPSHVKVTLHRARRALSGRTPSDPLPVAEQAVGRLLAALATGDIDAVVEALAPDVISAADAAGRYHAARQPVLGAERVARLLLGLYRKNEASMRAVRPVVVSGHPAVVVELADPPPGIAATSVLVFDAADGRVRGVWSVLADEKLLHVSGYRPLRRFR